MAAGVMKREFSPADPSTDRPNRRARKRKRAIVVHGLPWTAMGSDGGVEAHLQQDAICKPENRLSLFDG